MKVEIKKVNETKFPSHCLSLALGKDDEIYASCYDGSVYCLENKQKTPKKVLSHDNILSGVSLCENSIISSGYDGVIKWTNPKTHEEIKGSKRMIFGLGKVLFLLIRKNLHQQQVSTLSAVINMSLHLKKEPSVKVYDSNTGDLIHSFTHQPPVQSISFSNDGRFLAAGNLMGEVRVWDLNKNQMVSKWTTNNFTGWGIIKGHYYTGGIFSIEFSPDDSFIYVAGMGALETLPRATENNYGKNIVGNLKRVSLS